MAFTYGFYNSVSGDRKYSADQLSSIFDGIVKDGVFDSIGELFAVKPGSGLQVLVSSGRAWFDHTWSNNDADMPLALDTPDATQSRIDAVVLEINSTTNVRANSIKIVKGTPSSSPEKPPLTDGGTVHQHPLAYVTVPGGAGEISRANIQNAVGTTACPFVTGILETASIDSLLAQWNGEFDDWFNTLKTQMTDNVALNLQNQVNERLRISEKASADQAAEGMRDDVYMTPAKVKTAIEELTYQVGDIRTSGRNLEALDGGHYLTCDGRAIIQSVYQRLYASIGTRFGRPVIVQRKTVHGNDARGGKTVGSIARSNGGKLAAIADNADVVMMDSNGVRTHYKSPLSMDRALCLFFIGEELYTVATRVKYIDVYKLTASGNTFVEAEIGTLSVSGASYCNAVGMMRDGNSVKVLIRSETGLYVAIVSQNVASIVNPYTTMGYYGKALLLDNVVYLAECADSSAYSIRAYKKFSLSDYTITDLTNQTVKNALAGIVSGAFQQPLVGSEDAKTLAYFDKAYDKVAVLKKIGADTFQYVEYPIVNSTGVSLERYRISIDENGNPVVFGAATENKRHYGVMGFTDITTNTVNVLSANSFATNESNDGVQSSAVSYAFSTGTFMPFGFSAYDPAASSTSEWYWFDLVYVSANAEQINLPYIRDGSHPYTHFIKTN